MCVYVCAFVFMCVCARVLPAAHALTCSLLHILLTLCFFPPPLLSPPPDTLSDPPEDIQYRDFVEVAKEYSKVSQLLLLVGGCSCGERSMHAHAHTRTYTPTHLHTYTRAHTHTLSLLALSHACLANRSCLKRTSATSSLH